MVTVFFTFCNNVAGFYFYSFHNSSPWSEPGKRQGKNRERTQMKTSNLSPRTVRTVFFSPCYSENLLAKTRVT